MGVPQSSPILIGFSLVNHPFLGSPMAMETPHMEASQVMGMPPVIHLGIVPRLADRIEKVKFQAYGAWASGIVATGQNEWLVGILAGNSFIQIYKTL